MNKQHPDDLQLQRFLNRTCSEHEYKRFQHHIHGCPDCRSRLHAYMDIESRLDHLSVLTAPSGLEDQIMKVIHNKSEAPALPSPPSSPVTRWRSELIHGFIAMAATFLFISSGVWGKMLSINPVLWSEDVQSKVSVIELVVQRISIQLLS
jgi:hypothetical protein